MLTLTRKTDYALVALSHLAHCRQAEAGPTSARTIAEAYHLPLPLLMNILKELAQAKLVSSTRGATGGYALAVAPERISLLEIINAIEGPVKLTACCDGLPIVGQGCEVAETCPIQGSIQKLHKRLVGFFGGVTLDELMDEQTCCQSPVQVSSSPSPNP